MTWIPAQRAASDASAQPFIDAIYGVLREGLVLVGTAITTDDPRSAHRAGRKARELFMLASEMLRSSGIDEAHRGRLEAGLRNLQRSIEQLEIRSTVAQFS